MNQHSISPDRLNAAQRCCEETRLASGRRLGYVAADGEAAMPNKIDLSGRNAVVTGGAQGIGRAIVERLLDSGAAVSIWDRDGRLAEKTAADLKRNCRVEAIAVDVSKVGEIEAARDATVKSLGRIDILVNNAGITGPNMKTWEYPPEDWSKVMAVNLDSQFYCCRAIVPLMIAQNYGRIVNIAVNCITPAAAKTALFEQMTQQHIDYMLAKIPRGRFVLVEEIASLVAFCASAECSFTTGAVFDISGGRATY
jgi:2-dehydro-3-deoxy-L-rhamnonate dehydrogenase (NAD+)